MGKKDWDRQNEKNIKFTTDDTNIPTWFMAL